MRRRDSHPPRHPGSDIGRGAGHRGRTYPDPRRLLPQPGHAVREHIRPRGHRRRRRPLRPGEPAGGGDAGRRPAALHTVRGRAAARFR